VPRKTLFNSGLTALEDKVGELEEHKNKLREKAGKDAKDNIERLSEYQRGLLDGCKYLGVKTTITMQNISSTNGKQNIIH
jgi:hypothetical protein